MNREKEFIKNVSILGIGKLLPKFCSFATLPILTACLTKEEYGTFDLIATLVMLVIPVATLQIGSAAFRFLIDCRGDREKTTAIISNIFWITIPISLIVSFVVQFFFMDIGILDRCLIAMYLFLDALHLTIGQITRGIGRNADFSANAVILSVTNMMVTIAAVYIAGMGLTGVLTSLVSAQAVSTLYLILRTKIWKYLDLRAVSSREAGKLLAYSWPMVPNNLSSWILKLSDRLIITAFLGVEANAVYAVANKIPSLLAMGQQLLVMAWHENASIAVKDTDSDVYYSRMLDKIFSLMFGCTVLLIAAVPLLFRVFIRGEYSGAYCQMPVLILAMFFFVMSSFFGGIYIAHKKTVNTGISTMVAASINLVIDFALVRCIGIWAGSVSTLVSYLLLYFYRLVNCRKFQPMEIHWKKQLLQIVILAGMLILCFQRTAAMNGINMLLAVVFGLYFNRNTAGILMKKIKKIGR